MRLVCPYTYLHPLAEDALEPYEVEFVDMGYQHDSYYKLLCSLWADKQSFLIVEHDIEIHPAVVPELEACPEPWCLYPYRGPDDVWLDSSLGCTRFSAELLESLPQFMIDLPVRDWRRLDCEITPRLHWAGHHQHIHSPLVSHHHVRNDVCDCGSTH